MLKLRTLGGLSIENSGSKSAVANRRPLALLALLAATGPRGLSRDKVVALLWPESDSEHGRNSLSQILSALRRELAGADPVLGTLELRVNTDVLTCDVMEFEERIAANDFDAATLLYTGPFLDGVFLKNTPEFERWVEQQRSRLERLQADALERLAIGATGREDHVSAAALWRRRAALAPNDSRAALKLMESLVASGEPASALAHYRVHESLLREDIGIEPDASLAEFAASLRRPTVVRPTLLPWSLGRTPPAIRVVAHMLTFHTTRRSEASQRRSLASASRPAQSQLDCRSVGGSITERRGTRSTNHCARGTGIADSATRCLAACDRGHRSQRGHRGAHARADIVATARRGAGYGLLLGCQVSRGEHRTRRGGHGAQRRRRCNLGREQTWIRATGCARGSRGQAQAKGSGRRQSIRFTPSVCPTSPSPPRANWLRTLRRAASWPTERRSLPRRRHRRAPRWRT